MSEKKTDWEQAIGELAALDNYRPSSALSLSPMEMPLEATLESRGSGRPYMGAVLGLGDLSLGGGYQKRDAQVPVEWNARLGYRRRF